MTEHLTDQQVVRFRRRAMDADELLAAGDHLAVCPECRRACRRPELQGSISALRDDIRSVEADHLVYELLEAKVDGRLDEVEREIVDSHLEVCPQCAAELGDLRTAKAALAVAATLPRGARLRALWRPLSLSAAAAVALVVWFAARPDANRQAPPVRSALPPEYQRMVALALRTQTVAMPETLAGLRGRTGTLLAGSDPESFRLLGPVGRVVEPDRPVFRWKPVPRASRYVASVYDAAMNEVASSGAIQTTEWTPPRPLARGGIYSWQVTARVNGGELLAPTPPAPEAKFQVLAQSAADEIASARQTLAGAHLALGLLYARVGLIEDAARELRAVPAAEASPDVVKKLIDQIESRW